MPRRTTATNGPTRTGAKGLSRELIVNRAIELADREGTASLSMRKLAQSLNADPMSLYRYVSDKDDLLGAMVDLVVAGIEVDLPDGPWHERMRRLILAARSQATRHPWSARIIEGRAEPTASGLVHLNRVVGIMRDGGFTVDLAHHALHVLGSRVLGFSQDLFDDGPDVRPSAAVAAAQASQWLEVLPHLAELMMAGSHEGPLGGCDDDDEFDFSLDLILDGLERARTDQES